MKKLIFIACDTNKISRVKNIIAQTSDNKLDIGYKFGLEFLYSKNGRKFISKINRFFNNSRKVEDEIKKTLLVT